jgi:hypothetical protein
MAKMAGHLLEGERGAVLKHGRGGRDEVLCERGSETGLEEEEG